MHWKSAAKLILQTSCFLELRLGRSPCCPSSATVNSEYLLRQINFRRQLFTVELGGRTLGWFVLANHCDLTRPSQGWGFLKNKIVFFKLISDVQPHFSKWKSHFQGSVVVGKQQIPVGNYLPHDALLRNLVSVLPVGGPPSTTNHRRRKFLQMSKSAKKAKIFRSGKPPAPSYMCCLSLAMQNSIGQILIKYFGQILVR